MLGEDVDGVVQLKQRVQRPLQLVEAAIRREDRVRAVELGLGRQKQRHLRHANAPVADLLPFPAEVRDLACCLDDLLGHDSRARGLVVDLKPPALHQHHRRLLLQRDRGLHRVPVPLRPVEAPCHQVPRHPRVRKVPRLDPRPIHRDRRRVVARQEVQRRLDRLRREGGVHPIAGELRPWAGLVDLVEPVSEVPLELPAVERLPLKPARIVPVLRRIRFARLGLPGIHRPVRPVELRAPALAVGPDAVELVVAQHLDELRDQELVHVRPEGAGHAIARLAFDIDGRPLRVMLTGDAVPHARVVDVEPHAMFARDLAPGPQRVGDNARRRPPDLRRVARVAPVPLAVILHVVGLHALQQRTDILLRGLRPKLRVLLVGVQVEVDAEESVFAGDPAVSHRERPPVPT